MAKTDSPGDSLTVLRRELEAERGAVRRAFDERADPMETLSRLAEINDRVIEELSEKCLPDEHTSLFAIGGYGRREVFPASDLDLLILDHSRRGEPAAPRIAEFLRRLWDLGFRVGQQVWTWGQLEDLNDSDLEFLLALSDVRPLVGTESCNRRLLEGLLPAKLKQHRAALTQFLLNWTRRRHREFRDTIYQLEPDLKESPGALRDYQVGRWIVRLTGSDTSLSYRPEEVRQAFAFICRLRICVHYAVGRDRNRLTHKLQRQIAPQFGYGRSAPRSAVESLMKEYFLRARILAGYCRRATDSLSGPPRRLLDLDETGEPETLLQVVRIFQRALREGKQLSNRVRNRILDNRPRLSARPSYPSLAEPLLELFQPRAGLYRCLSELYELGVLELLFPEFASIRARVIRDFYHRYTVDEHSLLAVQAVEELASGTNPPDSRFRSLLRELARPERLTITLLLHDVGKSRGGKHVDTGARMAVRALRRYRFDQELIDQVAFLIRNHLAMSAVMLKRDIDDPAEVDRFADLVGDPEKLRLLCLLTYADIKAVAPGALNRWKRDRLWQLFVATYNRLTLGFGEERAGADTIREKLLLKLPPDIDFSSIENFLKGFPRRYLTTTPAEEIFQHYRLGTALGPESPVQVMLEPRGSHWELCVVTADRHRMFSRIAGLLAAFGMNILRGYAFSNRRDTVLDYFQFNDTEGTFGLEGERERFQSLLVEAVQDRLDVKKLLARRESSPLLQPPGERIEPVVHFDADGRRDYSIVEIVASDSVGLLYRISRAIADAGCNIELVLISTEGNKAVDVFYLTYRGGKLDAGLRARLKAAVTQALG